MWDKLLSDESPHTTQSLALAETQILYIHEKHVLHAQARGLLLVIDAAAVDRRDRLALCCPVGILYSSGSLMDASTGVLSRTSRFSGTMHGSSSKSTLSDSDLRLSGTSGMQGNPASLWK